MVSRQHILSHLRHFDWLIQISADARSVCKVLGNFVADNSLCFDQFDLCVIKTLNVWSGLETSTGIGSAKYFLTGP